MTSHPFFLLLALTLTACVPTEAASVPKAPHAFTVKVLAPELTADVLTTNRRIATAVRARHSESELYPATGVGFARDVALDDRLAALLATRYARELANLPAPAPQMIEVDGLTLERIFGKPAQLQLGYTLAPDKQALAARTPLARDGAGTFSMEDVLRRQNVQGRMEFFNHSLQFMHAQARRLIASRRVLAWAGRSFGDAALADLRQALADQEDVQAGMSLYGLDLHAESESPIQAALSRQVGRADIDAWYAAHREQFRRVDKVRARHISAASEAAAREVMAQAAAGVPFETLARRHSKAPDGRSGGQLGWIKHSAGTEWLAALALSQPRGVVSGPFRTPVGPDAPAQWEVLLIDERVEGFHPPDSETVRYEARKAIAAARARQQFASLSKGQP